MLRHDHRTDPQARREAFGETGDIEAAIRNERRHRGRQCGEQEGVDVVLEQIGVVSGDDLGDLPPPLRRHHRARRGPDAHKVDMQLRVAAVGGSFEGEISLSDKQATRTCNIKVSDAGTLGHGDGTARFEIEPDGENGAKLVYKGTGEIRGLVAGVGQRILASVSKHLIGRFFVALRKEFEQPISGAA
jgi:uncharacterized protein